MKTYEKFVKGKETTGEVIRLNFKRGAPDKPNKAYDALMRIKKRYTAKGVHIMVGDKIVELANELKV